MSTQDPSAGIPISILPEGGLQHVRLLELPPELLALVTSETPPLLQLKSEEDVTGDDAQDANAVLCTKDKTYNIRQVNTSNSVYLTRHIDIPDESGEMPRVGIQAFSKCDSTLELLPAAKQSAVPYIKKALPTYASTGSYASSKSISQAELFSHIPLSEAECQEGWTDLACFESTNPVGSFIPSAKVRVEVLEAALTAAIAEGADLTDAFIADDIPVFALDLRNDWPVELLAAIFTAVSVATPGGNLAIDEQKCIRFLGLAQLELRSGSRGTEVAGFKRAWRDSVPEAWRSKCELNVIAGVYSLQDNGSTITYLDSSPLATSATASAPAEGKSAIGAKRKWHEKFAAQKKKT